MKAKQFAFVVVAALFLSAALNAAAQGRTLRKEVVVDAPLEEVWKAWTTSDGATTFFGRRAHIDLTLGGAYEIYFSPDQPFGLRGSEGCQLHSLTPMKSLAFTWNAPPHLGALRYLHTLVFVEFEALEPGKIKVRLTVAGLGEGEQWDKYSRYFDGAWDAVLRRLQYRFAHGPLDWNNVPPGLLYRGD